MDGLRYECDFTFDGHEATSPDPSRLAEDFESAKVERRHDLIRAIAVGSLTIAMYVESLVRIVSPGPIYLLFVTVLGAVAIVTTSNRLDGVDKPPAKKNADAEVKTPLAKLLKRIWPAILLMIFFGALGFRSIPAPAAFPLVLTIINLFFVIADNNRIRFLKEKMKNV